MFAVAKRLVDGAITGGGITVDLEGRQGTIKSAFLVGGAVPSLEHVIEGDFITMYQSVEAWLVRNEHALAGHVLGSWVDNSTDTVTFDVVTLIRETAGADYAALADIAVALGRVRGELAVGYIDSLGNYADEFWVR